MKAPKYKLISAYIKEQITNGTWPVGSRLPSQRELARQFEVNRSTIITALDELAADGLIEGKLGMGTVVINNTWTLMRAVPLVNWNEQVKLGAHQASIPTVQAINQAESNENLIQLSKGELSKDLFPLDDMRAVITKVGRNLEPFGYEDPKGNLLLREAISKYLSQKDIKVSTSSIIVVSGALQALHLISIGLLERGSTVFLEDPSYVNSLSTFQSAGMKLQGIPMDKEGILPEKIEAAHQNKYSVLYCHPTFHNPTGALMGWKRRQELLKLAEQKQIPIIEDDVYSDLWLDSPPPLPIKSHDRNGNVLYLGSLSKSLNPGLRIGWIVGPEAVMDRLADLKMQTDYGTSSISQRAAAEWLSSGLYEQHLLTVRKHLKARRNAALQALDTHLSRYAEWEQPAGGFFIWVKFNPEVALSDLYRKALAHGVLINPGKIYSNQKNQYFRLSFANGRIDDIVKGIAVLESLIKDC
ncbi:PLP-dependent aminotransferase family protein [Mesobacillus stamsii]|uniref:GntR family transcriptional regulator of abcA and norABC n=1 Tax=Mesobacillus stamsii TaxID=225347 RepID=A0ABU0FPP0_9BACI|nr:PLP-dependent aminotransferase family protein [Mesobacillus stamsii]MDQ0411876.1 GntR family transcriptional regulator of abcA and norABC [Mesobacillus stamsii]